MANANRDNKSKIDLSLLPAKACEEEAAVWQMGEKKYGRYNWLKLWGDDTVNVVMASLLRHAFRILDGEHLDKESGLSHAAHIRCNAAMLIEYYSRINGVQQSPAEELLHNLPAKILHGDITYTLREDGTYDRAEKRSAGKDAWHTFYSNITEEQLFKETEGRYDLRPF